MVGLKVMQQSADIDIFEFFVPEIAIDQKIDYNEESSAVYAVVFADLFHRLVAKTSRKLSVCALIMKLLGKCSKKCPARLSLFIMNMPLRCFAHT